MPGYRAVCVGSAAKGFIAVTAKVQKGYRVCSIWYAPAPQQAHPDAVTSPVGQTKHAGPGMAKKAGNTFVQAAAMPHGMAGQNYGRGTAQTA